MNRMVL